MTNKTILEAQAEALEDAMHDCFFAGCEADHVMARMEKMAANLRAQAAAEQPTKEAGESAGLREAARLLRLWLENPLTKAALDTAFTRDAFRIIHGWPERLDEFAGSDQAAEQPEKEGYLAPWKSATDLRKLWRDAGGSFHGPNVETGTMPEATLLPFLRKLVMVDAHHPDSGEWVSVADRLPEIDTAVWVSYFTFNDPSKERGQCAGLLDKRGDWYTPETSVMLHPATHWMPLPPAPKDQQP